MVTLPNPGLWDAPGSLLELSSLADGIVIRETWYPARRVPYGPQNTSGGGLMTITVSVRRGRDLPHWQWTMHRSGTVPHLEPLFGRLVPETQIIGLPRLGDVSESCSCDLK